MLHILFSTTFVLIMIQFTVLCGTASLIFAQEIPESTEDHEAEHKKRILDHRETTTLA